MKTVFYDTKNLRNLLKFKKTATKVKVTVFENLVLWLCKNCVFKLNLADTIIEHLRPVTLYGQAFGYEV